MMFKLRDILGAGAPDLTGDAAFAQPQAMTPPAPQGGDGQDMEPDFDMDDNTMTGLSNPAKLRQLSQGNAAKLR